MSGITILLFKIKLEGVYGLCQLNESVRLCLLTVASHHFALTQRRTPIHYRHILGRALQSLQTAISEERVDEHLLVSITCIAFLEMAAGNYRTAHSHFKGITAMIQYLNENNRRLDPLMTYVIQTAWNADAVLALCGYGLAIPSELVSKDIGWVKMYGISEHVETWIGLELRITDYLYDIAIYKEWAEGVRLKLPCTEEYIVKRGEALESAINR
jgi:hypothetical protein